MSSVKDANLFKSTKCKRKRRDNQEVRLNPALAPPYAQKFPIIQKQHQRMILQEINSIFNLTISDQSISKKKRKLMKNRPNDTPEKIKEILIEIFSKKVEYKEKDLHKLISSLDDSHKLQTAKEIREYAIIGTRDITRFIKRGGELYLIMCCDSGESWICQDILCQALLANIPVCSINGLMDIICEFLSIKKAVAIAFKKTDNSPFEDLAEFIIDKIPDVHSPWIKLWKERYSNIETNICNIETNISNVGTNISDKNDILSTSKEAENITNGDVKLNTSTKSKIAENSVCNVDRTDDDDGQFANRVEEVKKSCRSDGHNGNSMSANADGITHVTGDVQPSTSKDEKLTPCDADGKIEKTDRKLLTNMCDENSALCALDGKTQTVKKMKMQDEKCEGEVMNEKCENETEYLEMNIMWKEVKLKTSGKKVKQTCVNKSKK